jgi:hypothetical protein
VVRDSLAWLARAVAVAALRLQQALTQRALAQVREARAAAELGTAIARLETRLYALRPPEARGGAEAPQAGAPPGPARTALAATVRQLAREDAALSEAVDRLRAELRVLAPPPRRALAARRPPRPGPPGDRGA